MTLFGILSVKLEVDLYGVKDAFAIAYKVDIFAPSINPGKIILSNLIALSFKFSSIGPLPAIINCKQEFDF